MGDNVGLSLTLEAKIAEFEAALDVLEKRISGLDDSAKKLSSTAGNLGQSLNKLSPVSGASAAGISNLESAVSNGQLSFVGFASSVANAGAAAASAVNGTQAVTAASGDAAEAADEVKEGNEDIRESITGAAGMAAATALATGLFLKFAFSGLSLNEVMAGTTVVLSDTEKAQAAFNKEIAKSEVAAKAEINTLESLVQIAQDEMRSKDEKSAAIKVINEKYPEYLKNLKGEAIDTNDASGAIAKQIDLLLTKSQVLGAQKAYEKALSAQADASYEVEQKKIESQKESAALTNGQTNILKEQVKMIRDVVNSIKENGISNKSFSIVEKANKDLEDANSLVDLFKTNLDEILSGASDKGFLDKILGDKDKNGKSVKTAADIIKLLNSELLSIDAQAELTGATFDNIAGDKITALRKAFEDLIKIGLKPTSPEIKKISDQINGLGDKIIGDKPIATKFLQGIKKSVQTTKVKPLTSEELTNLLGISSESDLQLDVKAKPIVIFEEAPALENLDKFSALFVAKTGQMSKDAKMVFDKNFIQWSNALDNGTLGPAIVNLGSQVQGAVSQVAEGIGSAIGGLLTGKSSFSDVLGSLIGIMGEFIIQFGKSLIEAATLRIIAEKTLLANPYLALAAGIGAVVIGTALKGKVPSFATGGVVNGPTLAMVGDNPSGKEAMIPEELWPYLGSNNAPIYVENKIEAGALVTMVKRGLKEEARVR